MINNDLAEKLSHSDFNRSMEILESQFSEYQSEDEIICSNNDDTKLE